MIAIHVYPIYPYYSQAVSVIFLVLFDSHEGPIKNVDSGWCVSTTWIETMIRQLHHNLQQSSGLHSRSTKQILRPNKINVEIGKTHWELKIFEFIYTCIHTKTHKLYVHCALPSNRLHGIGKWRSLQWVWVKWVSHLPSSLPENLWNRWFDTLKNMTIKQKQRRGCCYFSSSYNAWERLFDRSDQIYLCLAWMAYLFALSAWETYDSSIHLS